MTPPRLMPGQEAWIRTLQGKVLGPLRVEVVEVIINRSGQDVRYRFEDSPLLGHARIFPIGEDRVHATREGAEG